MNSDRCDAQSFLDVPYARQGDHELLLDIFLPPHQQNLLPVLLVVAGGGWRRGLKTSTPARYANRGFAIVGICYRGTDDGVIAPGNIQDCKAAVRWIRANATTYGFDPNRIGAFGSSAGGHLVGLLGTSAGVAELEGEGNSPSFSSEVQAVCDICGPADLTRVTKPKYKAAHPHLYQLVSNYLGGPVEEHMDMARLLSPLHHISKKTPPFMLMHGDADEIVPVEESLIFYAALQEAGVDVALKVLDGVGHGNINWDQEDETILAFFEKHFLNKPKSVPQ